jgi:hypothetical protein
MDRNRMRCLLAERQQASVSCQITVHGPLGAPPLTRSSSSRQRVAKSFPGAGATRQRVAAALGPGGLSASGRSSRPSAPPASAASCSRRVKWSGRAFRRHREGTPACQGFAARCLVVCLPTGRLSAGQASAPIDQSGDGPAPLLTIGKPNPQALSLALERAGQRHGVIYHLPDARKARAPSGRNAEAEAHSGGSASPPQYLATSLSPGEAADQLQLFLQAAPHPARACG